MFKYCCEDNEVYFKYAKGRPAAEGNEFHRFYEIVFFMGGEAQFISKNIQQTLLPYSVIIVPKGEFHQLIVDEPEDYIRCLLTFFDTDETADLISRAMSEVKIIQSPGASVKAVFENLISIAGRDMADSDKLSFVKASVLQLLVLFSCYDNKSITVRNINLSPVVRQALSVIESCYTERVDVEGLAKRLHVSASTLSHEFSRELGISVYKYISQMPPAS